MNTLSELTAATKLKPKRGEDDDDFRKRLVEAVSDLDDKTYGKMSKATRTWADSAIETFNETGKVPVFAEEEGDEDEADADDEAEDEEDVGKGKKKKPVAKKKAVAKDEEEEDVEEDEEEDGDVKEDGDDDETETEEDEDMQTQTETGGGRRSVKKGAAKAASGKGKKKVAAAGRKADGKSGGGQTKLKQILARDPDMSIDDLEVRLKKQGHEMSRMTLSTQRSGFRHTVKVLQEAGLLKKPLIS